MASKNQRSTSETNPAPVQFDDFETRVLLFVGVMAISFGVALLGLRSFMTHEIRQAENWAVAECTIVENHFVPDREAGLQFRLAYDYQYQGKTYRGDRVDLLPQSIPTGDRHSHETLLSFSQPVGAQAICYVDPGDPRRAVLDRHRGSHHAQVLLVIAFPCISIGVGFLLAGLRPALADWIQHATENMRLRPLPPAPRRMHWSSWAAILVAGPYNRPLRWVIMVACTYVFFVTDGRTGLTEVVKLRQCQTQSLANVSGLGKLAAVLLPASRADAAGVAPLDSNPTVPSTGITLSQCVGVVALGIAGTLLLRVPRIMIENWRVIELLSHGRVAQATTRRQLRRTRGVQASFTFEAAGQAHTARFTTTGLSSLKFSRPDQVTVVYDPRRPSQNVAITGLEHHLACPCRTLSGMACLCDLLVPVLSLIAIGVLVASS